MKKTFKQIREFSIYSGLIAMRHPNTKISYAIKKVLKKLVKIVDEYNGKLEDIRIDHCFTNSDGVIEYNVTKDGSGNEVRHYKFKKDELKKKLKEEREVAEEWNSKEFEVEPYLATEVPEDITDEEKEALDGFVLKLDETPIVAPIPSNGEESTEPEEEVIGEQ